MLEEAIREQRVRRDLAHHDDPQSVRAALEPVLRQERHHLFGLAEGAHEGDHHLDVGQPHVVAHALERAALQLETIVELRRDVA